MNKTNLINRRQFLILSAGSFISTCTNATDQTNKVIDLANTYKIEESIIVNRSIKQAFAFVSDLNHADKISDHLKNIQIISDGHANTPAQYTRQLIIHGFPQDQTVNVTQHETDKIYKTSTHLFDVQVHHTYRFIAVHSEQVKITLTKEAPILGFWDSVFKPIIKHQLTRPEHDGQHLITLKKAIETA